MKTLGLGLWISCLLLIRPSSLFEVFLHGKRSQVDIIQLTICILFSQESLHGLAIYCYVTITLVKVAVNIGVSGPFLSKTSFFFALVIHAKRKTRKGALLCCGRGVTLFIFIGVVFPISWLGPGVKLADLGFFCVVLFGWHVPLFLLFGVVGSSMNWVLNGWMTVYDHFFTKPRIMPEFM